MSNRNRICFAGILAVLMALGLSAGCGGGGGGGGGRTEPPKPPLPPFSLSVYEGQKVASRGTVTSSENGLYVVALKGKKETSFHREDIRFRGREVTIPIGLQKQQETFSLREFQKAARELQHGKEARLKSVSTGLTYVLQPLGAPEGR